MDESLIVPPEDDRKDILKSAHEFGHYGAESIVQHIRKDEGMNWPNILKDALEIVKQCAICQKFVISKRGYNPLKPLYCYTPGWHYQMDLCGPFPCTSSNNTYILVLLDVATRFLVLRPINDKAAKTVARELISIFSLIGYPRILNSDRGTEFKNTIMDELCKAMKIDKRLSTAYYSQGNGGAERAVQNTKKLLSKLILGISEGNWDLTVDTVQLMINCKISKRLNTSSFNLMFARKMSDDYPLFADPADNIEPMTNDELLKRIEYMSDVVFPAIKERTDIYNKMMKNQFDGKHRLLDIPVGSFVVVRKKGIQKSLSPIYEGPYEVIRKTDRNNYTLRDELGLLLPREYTPSELKPVSQDAVVSKEDVYEFDAIVDHRGKPGNREYKVRWKNYTADDDSWLTANMFTDPQAIVNYWKRVKGVVPKEDQQSMPHQSTTDVATEQIHSRPAGNLLQSIDTLSETVTAPSLSNTSSSSSSRNQRVNRPSYTRTNPRTKPVPNNPLSNTFRRNGRSILRANDQTRYKKIIYHILLPIPYTSQNKAKPKYFHKTKNFFFFLVLLAHVTLVMSCNGDTITTQSYPNSLILAFYHLCIFKS
jgi:transposase InsO family protein